MVAQPAAPDGREVVRGEVLRPLRAALPRRGRPGAELLLLRRAAVRGGRAAVVGAVRRRVPPAQGLRHHARAARPVQGHRPAHAQGAARLQRRDGRPGRGGLLQAGVRLAPAARDDDGLRPRRARARRRRVRRLLPHPALDAGPRSRPAAARQGPRQGQGGRLDRPPLSASAGVARGVLRQRLGDHPGGPRRRHPGQLRDGLQHARPARDVLLDPRRLVGVGAAGQHVPDALLAAPARVHGLPAAALVPAQPGPPPVRRRDRLSGGPGRGRDGRPAGRGDRLQRRTGTLRPGRRPRLHRLRVAGPRRGGRPGTARLRRALPRARAAGNEGRTRRRASSTAPAAASSPSARCPRPATAPGATTPRWPRSSASCSPAAPRAV